MSETTPIHQEAAARFVEARLETRDRSIALVNLWAGLLYHPACLLLNWLLVPRLVESMLAPVHATIAVLSLAMLVAVRHGLAIEKIVLAMQLCMLAIYASLLRFGDHAGLSGLDIMERGTRILVLYFVILCPTRGVTSWSTFALYSALLAASTPRGPLSLGLGITDQMVLASAVFARHFLLLHNRRAAEREFLDLLKTTPAQIVYRAALDGESIERLFEPQVRFGCYLCSDWRGYQKIAGQLEPAELAAALQEYYAGVDTLLATHLTDGNYFSDWIADELFIVIYETAEIQAEAVALSSLAVGMALLRHKEEFVARRGFPRSIDVGVAAGETVMGMLGPRMHRKATALGVVSGRARRMESAGKYLRGRFGEQDRVVFGEDLFCMATEHPGVSSCEIPNGEQLRDLPDRRIYALTLDPVGRTVPVKAAS